MEKLRTNQINAINISVENDFESGIHFHATGTGKSWIAMNILALFNTKYPEKNIIWLCEKKSILIEQFDTFNLKKKNFLNIVEKFNVFNFSSNKKSNWYEDLPTFSTRPILLIINRAFLTSCENYKKINTNFDLIIHDECHSIKNNTTQQFYNYMLDKNSKLKCIGFSATPYLEIYPFNKILSSYSIYDAFKDNVIVPPKIKWFTSKNNINDTNIIEVVKILIKDLYYKKIIVWCGMIDLCYKTAILWKDYYKDFIICTDTCKDTNTIFKTYKDFEKIEKNAILFCACKHREGSDIKNLDCCIFLDKVEQRCPKVFVQSIGRVLRIDKNNKKKFGLIVDIKAKSTVSICSSINNYLNISNIFPWHYDNEIIKLENGTRTIKINTLIMQTNIINSVSTIIKNNYTICDLTNLFKRKLDDICNESNIQIYKKRLETELNMIYKKNLIQHLIQAIDILKITENIPHVTRGSSGSSLVCYLLGISHIDPVKYGIKFSRFLNEHRKNLPDIDLDFPHNLRDQVFFKLELKWPGKIARISNHVFYHDRSALRQALRNIGIKKFIGKYELNQEILKFSSENQELIKQEKKKLEETFSHYSLHCGGIVYYPDGVPKDLLLKVNKPKILYQISLNKIDIAKDQNFKIDILSSRALSQLHEILKYKDINFENFEYDKKTCDMLAKGENIGLTLAESPLIRMAFMKFQPKNIYEIAICLSIIRPAAKDANKLAMSDKLDNQIIFDDDAIDIISKEFNICEDDADKYRRAFSKGDKDGIEDFKKIIKHLPIDEQKTILKKLRNLSKYGFCKAHAFSYAQLIWKLAYCKANNTKEFWKATLNNCHSSYKKWVHLYEAKLAGVEITVKKDISIYAENRRRKINNLPIDEQLRNYGYWNMTNNDFFPDCYYNKEESSEIYYFNGIIAAYRLKKNPHPNNKQNKMAMIFIGVAPKKYIQINIHSINYFNVRAIGIKGEGVMKTDIDKLCQIISCEKYNLY